MASEPTDTAASSNFASLRDDILRELVDVASAAANAQLDGLTTRLADALQRAAAQCADPAQARRATDAAQLLRKNRYPFYYVVSERLRTALQREIELAAQPALPRSDGSGALKSLPPDLEVDRKICLIQVSRVLETAHTERLTLLGQRLGRLLERGELAVADNPFRPQVFLSVLHDAWCEFHPDTDAHPLLFPHLQADRCIDMAPLLHALNTTLARRGVTPRPNAAVAEKTPDVVTAVHEQPANDAQTRKLRQLFPSIAATPDEDRPLNGAFPALMLDDAWQASTARKELLAYLTTLSHSLSAQAPSAAPVLAAAKRRAPADALTPADEHTFDLLIGIFDAILRNPDVPAEIGALIGSLQLPMLQTTLADKDFFFTPQHPARRALELLVNAGIEWAPEQGHADPRYQAVRHGVERVRQQAFGEVVSTLELLAAEERHAAERLLAAPIAAALQREKRQQAARAARDEVALRVGTGEVVALVETFLEDKWVAVLTLAYGVKNEKPQLVANAVSTMDDLVWSVKPKLTMAERKQLLAKLPTMLATLNKWLDLIKWDDAERQRFFTELAACHASIMRAPLDLSPERQARIALRAAKHATERRLRKQAAQPPQPQPDEFDARVQTLEDGAWLEFTQPDGVARRLRLAWVSPMRGMYVFATRARQEALTLSCEELAQALRQQQARVLSVAGLVERAITATLGIDSANVARVDDQVAA
jgi:hypothetical protein